MPPPTISSALDGEFAFLLRNEFDGNSFSLGQRLIDVQGTDTKTMFRINCGNLQVNLVPLVHIYCSRNEFIFFSFDLKGFGFRSMQIAGTGNQGNGRTKN